MARMLLRTPNVTEMDIVAVVDWSSGNMREVLVDFKSSMDVDYGTD
jgi:hypothetical protein